MREPEYLHLFRTSGTVAQNCPSGSRLSLQKPVNFEQFRRMVKQLGLYWLLTNTNQLPSPSAVKTEKAGVTS
jgi:hypothetical protein